MPLYKEVRDLINRYSFIEKSRFEHGIFYVYYKHDDKLKSKHLPFRADKDQLIKMIDSIKKEIDYDAQMEKVRKDIKKQIEEEEKKETGPLFSTG